MKKYLYTLLILIPIIFSACSGDKKDMKEVDQNKTAKQQKSNKKNITVVTLKDMNGETIIATKIKDGFTFSNTQGKAVLVSFFATWCPPCKAEIPHLVNLQEKYKDKLKIVGILLEQNKDIGEIKKFINFHAINYTITNGNGNYEFAQMYGGVKNIPLMAMYDKNGKYFTYYKGAVPQEMIDADIESMLKK